MPKYKEHRSKIKSGDLLAWSHEGWRTWRDWKIQMIRIFTRSEYSHVAVAWVVGGRVLVIEAVRPMARIYPLSKLGDFYHLPMNAPWKPETEEATLNFVGTEYSQLAALKAFFRGIGYGARECAQLVITVSKSDGIDLGERAVPDAVMLAALKDRDTAVYFVESE